MQAREPGRKVRFYQEGANVLLGGYFEQLMRSVFRVRGLGKQVGRYDNKSIEDGPKYNKGQSKNNQI